MPYNFSSRNQSIITNRNVRARRQQIKNIPSKIIKSKGNSIFLSGGIGDFLALESHFSQVDRDNLETVYYGTQKSSGIIEIFNGLNTFPRLKNHVVVWDDFAKFWCFYSKDECVVHLKTRGKEIPELNMADDWGIMAKFPKIHSGYFPYTRSSPIINKLCSLNEYDLPENYLVVCPYSTDKRLPGRDFTDYDWNSTIVTLRRMGMKGVLLNNGIDITPNFTEIIDLSNQTSLVEAIEILKNAKGYIGINSALSVLASKLFNYPNLRIKSMDWSHVPQDNMIVVNDHCFKYKHIYYAPQKTFEFLKDKIYILD